MNSTAADYPLPSPNSKVLLSWLLLCTAIALHVFDEATHNFLAIYNPTVIVLRELMPWLPFPVFTFRMWITGLVIAIAFRKMIRGFLDLPCHSAHHLEIAGEFCSSMP